MDFKRTVKFLTINLVIGSALLLFSSSLLPRLQEFPLYPVKSKLISVLANDEVTIEVLDGWNGQAADLEIEFITLPYHGTVDVNNNKTFNYRPFNNLCEKQDSFSYVIFHPQGSDTAAVFLEILCEPFTILSGFTTKEEKHSGIFKVWGIEKYPNNELSVFNQVGTEVFVQKGYQNNWNGKIKGKTLPAGVYYYVLDDGAGKTHSGTLEISQDH